MTEKYQVGNYIDSIPFIQEGAITVYPTETVYGIGAVAVNSQSLKKIFAIKKRSLKKPLSLNISNVRMAQSFISSEDFKLYQKIAAKFLPGPLSVIFKTNYSKSGSEYFTHQGTISLRMPANDLFLKVLEKVGPMPGTSANLSGNLSLTQESDVLNEMNNKADIILLDGDATVGVESTILDLSKTPIIRRSGAISAADLSNFLEEKIEVISDFKHYQLKKKLFVYHNKDELANLIKLNKNDNFVIWGNSFGFEGNKKTLGENPLKDFFKVLTKLDNDPHISIIFAQNLENDLYTQKLKEIATKWE
ncbi:L-threonylcarbamoyladenylate synthase [Xylocopilactobacillus apis]|uniref:Threonylcarbamoyl-AMP synthase n=1 Tax=Xylocopilactobacillus apis TaxID=2932183 RepID=A0AAU9D5W1_9LACO|nr:L-threonylcarbamoyladenylate synthase [Xylocopilactobacillus apis]BDR56177.1 threonylcarbamoyl-AMP synthase [Xylocopilactobacillus apis]